MGRGGAAKGERPGPEGLDERSGACADEGGGSDLLKLDDALASVDDFVAEKLK